MIDNKNWYSYTFVQSSTYNIKEKVIYIYKIIYFNIDNKYTQILWI